MALTLSLAARTYYVAPAGGSDMYPGTITQPWATWQKAFNTATDPGDTVYFRGGTWMPTDANSIVSLLVDDLNGTHDSLICFIAYPGETPIFDCSNTTHPTAYTVIGLNITDCNNVKFKGLTIRNRRQTSASRWVAGISTGSSPIDGNLYFENVTSSGHGGAGFWMFQYDTLYLINCDSYNNCDSLDSGGELGGRANGYSISPSGDPTDLYRYTYIEGCRAWSNSADGIAISTTKQFHAFNNWSFGNGKLNGDGTGFKFCNSYETDVSKRSFHNNLAAFNRSIAYMDANIHESPPYMQYYNNTTVNCGGGFYSFKGDWDGTGGSVIYRNNISYHNSDPSYEQAKLYADNYGFPDYATQEYNTWITQLSQPFWVVNTTFTVTDDDFVSLDSTQLYRERKSDGSLPDVTFMKLALTSDLIDRGLDVGLPYSGDAPDLGYSEYIPGFVNQSPTITISSPTKSTSFVSPATVTIEAVASDPDGSIIKIEFYNGTIKLGERITTPYSFTWKNVTEGTYSITAIATDNLNSRTVSTAVSVNVLKSTTVTNQLPIINILTPESNSLFEVSEIINLTSDAYDNDGDIIKVEYFRGSEKIGESLTSPYSFSFECVDTGKFELTAIATDNRNASARSYSVCISVAPKSKYSNLIQLFPNPNNGHFTVDLLSILPEQSNRIKIVSLSGNSVFNHILTEHENSMEIDLSDRAPGTYVLMVVSGDIVATKKFIKQ